MNDEQKNVVYILANENNSDRFLSAIAERKCSTQFLVVDVTDLQASDIEDWLTGVPTVVERNSGRVLRGTDALNFVRNREPDKQEVIVEEEKDADVSLTDVPNAFVPPDKDIGRRARSEFSRDNFKRKH